MNRRLEREAAIPRDAWYDSEQLTRAGLIRELQRIQRRTRARPFRVILLAAVLTTAIAYKVAVKKPLLEAEVVLALTEGALAAKTDTAPPSVEQLKEYVSTVLLPDDKLLALIKEHNLYPLRKTMGDQFAIGELREQVEITIWKNSFVYYDEDIQNPEHSARIGITVSDTDPDRALYIARDLSHIVMKTAEDRRKQAADILAKEAKAVRDGLANRLDDLAVQHSQHVMAIDEARNAHRGSAVAELTVSLEQIEAEERQLELQLDNVLKSRDTQADQIAAAGLDMNLQVVEEHVPEHAEKGSFVPILILVVVGVCALLGSALILGAFDSRVHDLDDLARLGVPVLGHIPGFPGDHVGALEARGVMQRRVPSFRRWRSQR